MADLATGWNTLASLAPAADHALFLRSLGLAWDCACADCTAARLFVIDRRIRIEEEAMLARTVESAEGMLAGMEGRG